MPCPHRSIAPRSTGPIATGSIPRRSWRAASPGPPRPTTPAPSSRWRPTPRGRPWPRSAPSTPDAKPLWGLPFAIKDNIDLAGVPTTAACPAFAYTPQDSATAVARLIAAGAIPVGKTNLDQFATGLVGTRSPYPIPKNSFDPAVVPGGSSSGSAVAVASGLVAFALGTDTAGSGRVPAGLNNLVGLKPTLGAVPVKGVVPACRTLDCVSVFGLTVEDSWAVAAAMAGYEAVDPWSRRLSLGAFGARPPRLRAGIPDAASRRFFGDAQSERAFDSALALHAAQGLDLVPIDCAPLFAVAALLYEGAWVAERYAAIRPFIAAHRGRAPPRHGLHRPRGRAPVRRRCLRGDLSARGVAARRRFPVGRTRPAGRADGAAGLQGRGA